MKTHTVGFLNSQHKVLNLHKLMAESVLCQLIRYVVYRVEYSSYVAYRLSDRQDERMDELNLFIDYHTKYTVSII